MIACKGFWAFSDIIQSSRIFVSGLRKLPYISPMDNQNLVVNRDFDFYTKPTVNRPALVAARLPTDLAKILDAERRRRGVTKSEVIFLALQEFLAQN
jgi:hypothetical protein